MILSLLFTLLFTLLASSLKVPGLTLSISDECSINLYSVNYNSVSFNNNRWEKKLDEPINGINVIKIGDDIDEGPLCKYCDHFDFSSKYRSECLIKIVSTNYIYYLNTTNGNIINKLHIIDNYYIELNHTSFIVECYNILINKWCIRDIIYNGSIFISVINNKWSPHDKCGDGPNVGNRCVTNNISIKHTFLGKRLI